VFQVAVRVAGWSTRTKRMLWSVRLSSEKPRPHALAKAAWSTTSIGRKKESAVTPRQ
jgi:hypothetical protein